MPSVKLNHQSIFEYLNFGFKIGNKTHIKGIYEFEAAKKYEIGIGLIVKETTYWSLLGKSERNKIEKEEFFEIFNNHHKRALKLENKLCIALTGGRDSRSMLSTYMDNLDKIRTYTHGPIHHTDVKFAKKLSSSQNIAHNFYKLNGKWYKNIRSKAFENKDVFNGLNPFFDNIHVVESLKKEQKFANLFISGALGNQLYRNYPFGNNQPNSINLSNLSEFIINNIPGAFYFKTNLTSYYDNIFKGYDIEKISNQIKKTK